MRHSIPSCVHPLSDRDVEYFKHLTDVSEGWDESFLSDQTLIQTRSFSGTNIRMLRANCLFSGVSVLTVYDYIQDSEYRATQKSVTSTSHTVCYLNSSASIEYICIQCMFPLRDRDLVLQKTCIPGSDDFMIIYHSVEDSLFPQTGWNVRAHTYITGYHLRCTEEGTSLTFISHSDPKGFIPPFLCNHIAKRAAPNMVSTMYRASLQYLEWKHSNNPLHTPWRCPEQRDKCLYADSTSLVKWGFLTDSVDSISRKDSLIAGEEAPVN